VPLADEGFQFEPQGLLLLGIERLVHLGNSLVFERKRVQVLFVDVAVLHFLFLRWVF
jgi:hypothetical protein